MLLRLILTGFVLSKWLYSNGCQAAKDNRRPHWQAPFSSLLYCQSEGSVQEWKTFAEAVYSLCSGPRHETDAPIYSGAPHALRNATVAFSCPGNNRA